MPGIVILIVYLVFTSKIRVFFLTVAEGGCQLSIKVSQRSGNRSSLMFSVFQMSQILEHLL